MPSAVPNICHCSFIRMAARRVSQVYDQTLAPAGVTVTQFSILGQLESRKERAPSMAELAEALGMDRSSMGHTLRPLERDRLVRFVTSSEDRRTKLIELTPAGLERYRKAHPLWQGAQIRFEKAFGKRAAADLRGVLGAVAALEI